MFPLEPLVKELHEERLRAAERHRLAQEARRVRVAPKGTGRQRALYWLGGQFTLLGTKLQSRSGLEFSLPGTRSAEPAC